MEILYLSIVVLLGSIVGTSTGFGLSTVMIPVVLLFYPLSQTLLFVGIIHCIGNIWKLPAGVDGDQAPAAGFLGAMLVFQISTEILSRILAGFIIFYVFYVFLRPDFKVKANKFTAAIGGSFSGFMAGIFGSYWSYRTWISTR